MKYYVNHNELTATDIGDFEDNGWVAEGQFFVKEFSSHEEATEEAHHLADKKVSCTDAPVVIKRYRWSIPCTGADFPYPAVDGVIFTGYRSGV